MAVTLISHPLGHKLGPELYPGVITDSGGDALITTIAGAPFAGQWVYIESNIERYNGFMYVLSPSGNTYKITPTEGGEPVEYIQESDAVIQISELEHGWQSVHLPIVYQLESDLFPLNVPESAGDRTILSFSSYGGQVRLLLSEPLDKWDDLEYVELRGAGPLLGVYQITHGIDSENIVIDLAYDASFDFSPYAITNYYNNYFIEIDVYAGLGVGHRWYDQKPFKIGSTLRLIPDGNNRVKFSVSEILKGFINTRNNLLLDTLPNNLDFYTQFNIEYREVYDEAVDGEVVVFEGDTTVDSFIGHAVNSMMPFKSLNESFMSDYISTGLMRARWLTLQDRPVAIVGYFFDLSFLLNTAADFNVTIFKSINGIVTSTEIIEIPNPGIGVIRVPFTPESGYDLYCIQASRPMGIEVLGLASFTNTGSGISWTTGSTPSVSLSSGQVSKILFLSYAFIVGVEYTIRVGFNYNISALSGNLGLGVYDSSNNLLGSNLELVHAGTSSADIVLSFTGIIGASRIGILGSQNPFGGSTSFTITSSDIESPGINITDQICIDIVEECGSTFTNDNLRITETELFRELE